MAYFTNRLREDSGDAEAFADIAERRVGDASSIGERRHRLRSGSGDVRHFALRKAPAPDAAGEAVASVVRM